MKEGMHVVDFQRPLTGKVIECKKESDSLKVRWYNGSTVSFKKNDFSEYEQENGKKYLVYRPRKVLCEPVNV